jgi:hypothetical protein
MKKLWIAFGAAALSFGCALETSDVGTAELELEPMNVYLGNFHAHTKHSDGSGTPTEGFRWARDVARLDFYAITDHAEQTSSGEWADTGARADEFYTPGSFVSLRGFEYSNPFNGHANVFGTSSYKGYSLFSSISSFYTWLDASGGVAQFNHPGDYGTFSSYAYQAKVADNFSAMETANGGDSNAGAKFLTHFNSALAKGWKLAPTGNLDNHSLSDSGKRTGVLARALTREEILGALKARRVYSTDDADLELKFSLGEAWMGATASVTPGLQTFRVSVADPTDTAPSLALVVKGSVVASTSGQTTWEPTLNVTSDTYAYVKVTQADGQVALSAPIWLDVP